MDNQKTLILFNEISVFWRSVLLNRDETVNYAMIKASKCKERTCTCG